MDNNDGVVLLKGGITYNDFSKESLLQDTWNVLEDLSHEILTLLKDILVALRDLIDSILSSADKIWDFIMEDLKNTCVNFFVGSWEALKFHFVEGCSCIKQSFCAIFKGDIQKALVFSYQSLDHIAFFIDILSYIPVLNVIAGIALVAIYLIQKEWGMAVVSVIFMIPFLKWFKKVPFIKNIIIRIEKYVGKLSKTYFKGKKSDNVLDIRKEIKNRAQRHKPTSNISIMSDSEKIVDFPLSARMKANNRWNMSVKQEPIYEYKKVANSNKTEKVVVGYKDVPSNKPSSNQIQYQAYSYQANYAASGGRDVVNSNIGKDKKKNSDFKEKTDNSQRKDSEDDGVIEDIGKDSLLEKYNDQLREEQIWTDLGYKWYSQY